MHLIRTESKSNNAESNQSRNTDTNNLGKTGIPLFIQQSGALLLLTFLSPILLITMVCIRMESPGAALFSQVRVGVRGRRFMLYKFRSMRTADDPKYVDTSTIRSDREGVCKKLFNDPRITKVGAFIRKYSIDELPQLLNVLKGDMVLIGPRPALPNETDQYSLKACGRLEAVPGLTGLWQVSGRADTTFEEQIDLDLEYVKQKSFLEDIRILLATIPVVFLGKGAY
jgi:lipopolysaccharide/colanic/teichoic acid biosynthesis glycosyltransferase